MQRNKRFFERLVIGSALLIGFTGCGQRMTSEVTPSEETLEGTAIETTSQKTEPASVTVVSATPLQSASTVSSPPSLNTSLPQHRAERNKQIQLALQHAGFYGGGIDGKVGPLTQKAVEDFQKSKGLKVDGKVGPVTWTELEKYLSEGTQQ